jgi:hypothetical protein
MYVVCQDPLKTTYIISVRNSAVNVSKNLQFNCKVICKFKVNIKYLDSYRAETLTDV